MKKHFLITIPAILFFIVDPLAFLNEINQTNQTNEINQTNQINQYNQSNKLNLINLVFAQETKKHPSIGPIQIPESYVIGQGDVLEVFVWRNEQLSRQATVRPDGKISLPLIQDFQAEGLTILQLKDRITRQFKQYVQNPTITVIVRQINSYKISVLGRVANPGIYPLTTKTTLLDAISMAGGFTEWADKRKITVITNKGGKKGTLRINYKKIVSGKDLSQNIILQRGDTIVVP
jgi:polysaccharide export outer membrane protein